MFTCPPPKVGMVPVNLFWDKMADCPVNPAPDSLTLILLCLLQYAAQVSSENP